LITNNIPLPDWKSGSGADSPYKPGEALPSVFSKFIIAYLIEIGKL